MSSALPRLWEETAVAAGGGAAAVQMVGIWVGGGAARGVRQ